FNVTLVGPGTFHLAMEITKRGDTCMKPLPGNSGEVSFSELLGTGTYKTKAGEAIFLPGGKVDGHTLFNGECGCPPSAPVLRAENQQASEPPKKEDVSAPKPAEHVLVANNDPTATSPPEHPGQLHVQVDAPFVFNARSATTGPYGVAKLQVSSLPNVFFVQEEVDPVVLSEKPLEVSQKTEPEPPKPVAADQLKPKKEGFMGKVKG